MVVFYTMAYNAEKTLSRTIRSVLNQTSRDFIYYLVDNGSTDGTWELIEAAAEKDRRIVPLRNAINHVWEPGNYWAEIVYKLSPDIWFCFLDADDVYKPTFLENMLQFALDKNLDIVCCGNDFIDAESDKVTSVRKLDRDLIIEGESFSFFFTRYHQFLRTLWGKLIRVHLMQIYDATRTPSVSYGGDTLYLLEFCRNANRIGVISKALHQYYRSPQSISYIVQNDRIQALKYLYAAAEDFLQEKCGQISPRNHDFLLCTFLSDTWDAVSLILQSGSSGFEKLNFIFQIYDFPPTKELLTERNLGRLWGAGPSAQKTRFALFQSLTDWMLALKDVPDNQMEYFCDMGELFSAAIDQADHWIAFKKLRIAYFLSRADRQIEELQKLGIAGYEAF